MARIAEGRNILVVILASSGTRKGGVAMSADNGVYVLNLGCGAIVSYILGSVTLLDILSDKNAKFFSSRDRALIAAHDLVREIQIVEYGVTELELTDFGIIEDDRLWQRID
jgi:hypothetical protein